MWNLGQFREKNDIFANTTAELKFKSKNPFVRMWHI